MKYKILLFILSLFLIFQFNPFINSQDYFLDQDNTYYILDSSFGFYKGTKDMSEIEEIIFSSISPMEYDECWNANKLNTSHIQGYLCGNKVFIVGNSIYANPDSSYMFASENSYGDHLWFNLKSIQGLEFLSTSYVENMKFMFAFTKLEEINGISNWDVSNVKNFSAMFQGHNHIGDIKLKSLNIENWNTSSAESMSHMFYGCSQMEYIPIDNWDVSNVKIFSHMFADCFNLKKLNLSKWQTNSAETFDAFLNDCHSLTVIDVSYLNTSNCRQFSQMFESCFNLQEIIGINNWDVSNANYYAFTETFHNCYSLTTLDLSNWRAYPDNTARMFKNCYSLKYLDISGLDLTNKNLICDEMYDGMPVQLNFFGQIELKIFQ